MEARDFLEKILNKDPAKRLGGSTTSAKDIKAHPFFRDIDWDALERKEVTPPYVPNVKSAEDLANIDEEFTSEPAAETLQEDSALLRAHRDNEAFDNFDFVNDKIADNIRATAMMGGMGNSLGGGMGDSFMEFSDSGPRFGITEIDPKTAQQMAYQTKNNSAKIDLQFKDGATDYYAGDLPKNGGEPRKESTQTTAESEDKYDF